jgi:TldD protein
MHEFSRRTLLRNSAWAAGAVAAYSALGSGWYALAGGEAPGYFAAEFGIGDALCRRILAEALGKGGDFAELYFEHSIRNWLGLEDGKVNRAFSETDLGVGIRVVKGDQVGYGFTQELTEKSMLAAAATAATIASAAATVPAKEFAPLVAGSYYPLDRLLTSVPLESKVGVVQSLNDRCFGLSKLAVKVTATFHDEQKRVLVVTSDGIKAEDLLPRTYLAATALLEKDGRRERASWGLGGRRRYSFYTPAVVDEIARTIIDRATVMFDAVRPPAGEMPVVLGPGITGVLLHEAIGHGMEADFNRKKMSTYTTMIGRKVAEPFVTIIDDGTQPELLGSINFDDEGTPSQRTVLVEQGILKSYMHDRISARHYQVKPTGNGRRESYRHFIQPRMRNTCMLAGQETPAELIRKAGTGLYVEDVSNGQVKIGEGDFAFYVAQGREIKDGALGAPIKDVNIMGNGPKMLANIIAMANDFQFSRHGTGACGKGGQAVPCGFGQPSVLVKSLTVGGVKA